MKITYSNPDLLINAAWLHENRACPEGFQAHIKQFPDGATYQKTREWLANIGQQNWANWLITIIGPDTATAGDRGTATAGDRGTATAGYQGTATAGNRGTATAGNRGTATAGIEGTATAGIDGTATAGIEGSATAG